MKLKLLLIYMTASLLWSFTARAQSEENARQRVGNEGLISLNPYIPESENIDESTYSAMITKLNQIATAYGMSGTGFDNRFIITAHLQNIKSVQTQTFPQKNAVVISACIYVGDGLDGTLFSNYCCEKKGIGDTEQQAIASAIRKINPNDEKLQIAIDKGKKQILKYYDHMSGNIIAAAKTAAANGKFEEAMSMLFSIPIYNKDFETAQNMIAQYGYTSLDNNNKDIVRKARSAWSIDPTESGAEAACELLEQLDCPSQNIQNDAQKLQNEIVERLKATSDREFNLEVKKANDEKETRLAAIKAVSNAAKAYAASRPKTIYKYIWW